MEKGNRAVSAGLTVLILVGAVGSGVGIKKIRSLQSGGEIEAEEKAPVRDSRAQETAPVREQAEANEVTVVAEEGGQDDMAVASKARADAPGEREKVSRNL